MENFFIGAGLALGCLTLVCLYPAISGPTVLDRIVSVGVIGTKTTVILLLMGFIYGRVDMFVDIALAYALLNFLATISAAKFFRTRRSIVPGYKHMSEREAKE